MAELSGLEQGMLIGVIVVAFISLAYAYWLWRDTLRRDKGNPEMQKVWNAIKTGANAYLQRQLRTMLPILGGLAIVLFFSVYVVQPSQEALAMFNNDAAAARLWIGIGRMLAFVVGASFSTIVGQLGMRVAIEGNIRVAAMAAKENYNGALTIAYRSGTFTGMLTDGLGLLGGTIIFMIFGKAAPDALLALAARWWRCSCASAAASTPRPPTWAPTWWARSSRACPRTTRAMRLPSPTWWVTTWATAPAWPPTFSRATR
jgi:K(+)-stimulated pyrophosphate-energized sodium pump